MASHGCHRCSRPHYASVLADVTEPGTPLLLATRVATSPVGQAEADAPPFVCDVDTAMEDLSRHFRLIEMEGSEGAYRALLLERL